MERIVLLKPYFLTNKKWYYYDYDKLMYILTKEAPQKAIESYNEFYKKLKKDNN